MTTPTVASTSTTEAQARSRVAGRLEQSTQKGLLRRYHAPRWDEPLIFQLSQEGYRGIEVPSVPEEAVYAGPEGAFRRKTVANLPQIGQSQVLRHYLRLSQETLGADLNVDIGQGTCTMKYSPKINERFAGSPLSVHTHPMQDASTVQGTLQILSELQEYVAEISGMDAVSLQAGAGSAAIYGNVKIVQAFHADRGEAEQRNEIVTTIFSHPSNAATAKTAGYKVITLYPDADGFPDLEALKSVISERTAALFITNPEDTGIFNSRITEYVDAVHAVGGLCVYDQANANGLLGIARAREAGFDLCHFNLHKTFSTPHACGGPAAGAIAATDALEPFLPGRRLVKDANGFTWEPRRGKATADLRPFYGVVPNLIRAYAWIRSLGADGLKEVAEIAVLNNNYLLAELSKVEGLSVPYAEGQHRLEQVRYSWQELTDATGVTSNEIGARMADYGMHYWTSHHPYIVPEPVTLEPTESYSKRELDEYIESLRHTAAEARSAPEVLHTAPHRSGIHTIDLESTTDPGTWITSWRAYRHKYLGEERTVTPSWQPPADLLTRERAPKAHHR